MKADSQIISDVSKQVDKVMDVVIEEMCDKHFDSFCQDCPLASFNEAGCLLDHLDTIHDILDNIKDEVINNNE